MNVQIENIYPLSPMQLGFLFHSLYDPNSSAYVQQFMLTLEGSLDVTAFKQAWQHVTDRHPALRSAFLWEDLDEPLQIVHRQVTLPIRELDWRNLSAEEQQTQFELYLSEERQQGFDIRQAPLTRAALIRMGHQRYRFVLNQHHLLLDGWSMSLLLREAFQYYEAFAHDQELALPPTRPYQDYIAWIRQQDQQAPQTYWQTALQGFTTPTPLPTGVAFAPERAATERYHEERILFSGQLTEELQRTSRQHKLTINTLLQGAWAILLSRYSDTTDVVFGTSIASRPDDLERSDSMVGVFINTIPVRAQIDPQQVLVDWLQTLQNQQVEARQYHYVSLAQIQSWSEVERGTSLFESTLVYDNYPMGIWMRNEDAGLRVSDVRILERSNYPLALAVVPTPELLVHAYYDSHQFNPRFIRQILSHFQTLLANIVADPTQLINDVHFQTPAARALLLEQINATNKTYPAQSIQHLFEAQVERTPHQPAVIDQQRRLSYQELNTQATKLAQKLQAAGVQAGTLVGICFAHSIDTLVAILGILKAGAAYVPLDPEHPPARLEFIINDAQPAIILTQQQLSHRLPQTTAQLWYADDYPSAAPAASTRPLDSTYDPDAPAYMIYTSGSTGAPKGVPIHQAALVNYISWASEVYLQGKAGNFALYSSLAFDLTITSIFTPLISGGAVVVYNIAGTDIEQILDDNQVDVLKLTPSHLSLIKDRDNRFSSMRCLIVGGEALETSLARTVHDSFGGDIIIYNEYGPTEATVGCMIHRFDPLHDRRMVVPIGVPAANMQIYVLDEQQRPVAELVSGELYISGNGLAQGYWQRPELSAERFIDHAFLAHQKMYKTGDRARWLPDGVVEYLGRNDDQVKFHGHRVELGEIKSVLNRYPNVRDSVIMITQDANNHQMMVAYYVARQPIDAQQLQAFLAEHVIKEVIPSIFVHLKRLPLTLNGKIDYRGLPSLTDIRRTAQKTYVAPQTPIEHTLAEIWSQVLGIEQVGIHDNFFELGGDSILSIRIIARANQAGLALTPKQLFQHRTIAQLASVVSEHRSTVQAEQELLEGPVPLTPIQHWFFEQQLTNLHHWNQAVLLQLREMFDPAMLAQALAHVYRHHDALRLRFTHAAGQWTQHYAAPTEPEPVAVYRLADQSATQQHQSIEALATSLQAGLNISDGPMIRVALFDLGESVRLLLLAHHLVVDSISWGILLEDVYAAYHQLQNQQTVQLALKTTSYRQWAEQLHDYATAEALHHERAYWLDPRRQEVAALPEMHGTDLTLNTEASAKTVQVVLDQHLTRQLLQDVPHAYNTQINDILLAALGDTLAQWTGQAYQLVDLESHGREDIFAAVDVSRTVGWFTSIYPMLLEVNRSEPLDKRLIAIKEQLRTVPQRGIGYGIARYLTPDALYQDQLRQLPQAQIAFNYLGQLGKGFRDDSPFGFADESSGPVHGPACQRRYLIDVNSRIVEEQLEINWTYSEAFHEAATIEQLAHSYLQALTTCISHCVARPTTTYTPSDFPLAAIQQAELDAVMQHYQQRAIADIYPLTPAQQGILFHSLYAPETLVYFTQLSWTLHGELNIAAFQRAWQHVVDRHPILRTSFLWEKLHQAFQIVHPRVELPWQIEDWRQLATEQQQTQLAAFLKADQQQGFELTKAPLMRVALLQLGDQSYHFVWSQHHILADGWCLNLLLGEAFRLYEIFCQDDHQALHYLEPVHPYSEYIRWLQGQDFQEAEAYWRRMLRDLTQPTPLPPNTIPSEEHGYHEQSITLSQPLAEKLHQFSREQELTISTLFQGLWAVLLSYYSQQHDIVYGCTVSGRPVDLPGVETMIGLFLNTLPVRVKVNPTDQLIPWLTYVQAQHVEMRQYEYTSLAHIQRWNALPARQPVFESVVVFENYAMHEPIGSRDERFKVSDVRSFIRNHYPLTLRVVPGEPFSLDMLYNSDHFSRSTITVLLEQLQLLLQNLSDDQHCTIATLFEKLAAYTQQVEEAHKQKLDDAATQKLKHRQRRAIRQD